MMSGGVEESGERTILSEGEDPLGGTVGPESNVEEKDDDTIVEETIKEDKVSLSKEKDTTEEDSSVVATIEKEEEKYEKKGEDIKGKEKAAVTWGEAWGTASKELPRARIGVDSPETVGNALNRHVVYRVFTEIRSVEGVDTIYEVRRRFSDFVSLRESLVKRYIGLLIPPIPPKVVSMSPLSSKAAEESTLVQSRLRLLSDFVDGLGNLPWIADDPIITVFCSLDSEHWLKISEEKISKTFPTPGNAMWLAVLSRSPQPPPVQQFEKVLSDTVNRLDSLQSSTDIAFKAAHKASSAAMSRADALFALKDGFQPWRGESARFSALAVSLPDKLSPSLADPTNNNEISAERGAAAVSAGLDAYAREADTEPSLFEKSLAAACQWQQLSLIAVKELITKRNALIDDIRKQQKYLDSLQSLKAAGKTPVTKKSSRTSRLLAGFSPGLATAASSSSKTDTSNDDSNRTSSIPSHSGAEPTIDELIEQAQRDLTDRENSLDLHARALCYCELDRFKRDYTAYQNKWAAAFFSDMTRLADAHKRCWENAHDALGIHAPV
mmetsp:Transcript_4561/g.6881  ORF Transcript_4561/g.6881 Transcript_4561/m.6881 type:complete len:553 (+) Transcript_4561:77-1735(+)|eukprot:CAMPEP_0197316460 /NCGR_PEP_ID=MMETSP0891-20130614/42781_1 /TAXON_ID=44058 ORGANISM="Aureoumbra lagunensis, Strain CCMP1510" /NCGR_SAMPLE_ID=MMETSP0891 /ASSEMBLY_ACC=CAM_ASM_000534 /LENGTH=552 /DNA_ID=CAMNT_0042805931 /DNA_START=48 /DNA_END=1706 /DNA_ORIENTATION=+